MFNSKIFTGIIALTLAVLALAVTLQLLEMNEYNLFQTIKKSFMGEETAAGNGKAESKENAGNKENAEQKAAE